MTSLPLVYAPFPATVDEREAATVLLEMLFWLWPDCPAEFLVGDSLYDHSNQFAIDLECKWGIHPVFSVHGRRDHQEIDGTVDGVPKCVHGFMKREKADDFVAGTRRLKKGLRRGEDIGHRKARLRWCCVAEICPRRTTYFARDPRKHTYMPIAGDHMLRFKREALLCRRNSIEQVFSFLKMGGFFGPGALRAKWAKTLREACWAYMLPMLFMTARRLVHEMGAYDESLGLADRLGLLQSPTLWSPTPGPDPLTLAVSQQQLPLEIRAPGTWMGP
jgi:hypothetical protein